MALDAVVFAKDQFGYNCNFKEFFQRMEDEISGGIDCGTHSWSLDDHMGFHEDDMSLLTILDNNQNATKFANRLESSPVHSYSKDKWELKVEEHHRDQPVSSRRKRRRTKACKNKEEVENQRMTHIAVERNRRKQMNEYLAVLRSLIPSSYALRGDQASIIGGAINFVKELEQLLQTLEAEKTTKINQQQNEPQEDHSHNNNQKSSPFGNFFTCPQYTTSSTATTSDNKMGEGQQRSAAAADIEVAMVESHANVKILAKRCSKQLVKLVSGFQSTRLTVQHLNVSSLNNMVLFSISVKIEEGCMLNTVDEIAAMVNQMLHKIEEESSG